MSTLTPGCTPLHLAALRQSPAGITAALSAGDNPNDQDTCGRTPLRCLLGGWVNATDQARAGVLDCLKLLVLAGADLDQVGKFGYCARQNLTMEQQEKVVEWSGVNI